METPKNAFSDEVYELALPELKKILTDITLEEIKGALMSSINEINGEYIVNFKEMFCHICNTSLGFYCLTDRFEEITPVCKPCFEKEKTKKK